MAKKKREPIFIYNDDSCICKVEDNMGRVFTGESHCHPEDKEYKSYLTGGTIAEMRARIAAARAYRDDLKIKLGGLKQYYYSICQSKKFDRHSYEVKMLFRQMNLIKNDLEIAQHQLAVLKLELFEYINQKDYVHQLMRKHQEQK